MKKYIILLITLLLLTGCGAPKDTLSINGMYLGKKASTDRENYVTAEDKKYESFTFEDDELIVQIELRYGEFYNIEVSPR